MKKVLLLTLALSLCANAAMADHIGIFSDGTGASCYLGPEGFFTSPVVMHKFSLGTTGSRFKVVLPPGSTFFAFNTPFNPLGAMTSDISVGYGTCLTGSFVIGTFIAILTPGIVTVEAADLQPYIFVTDCTFEELPASGGGAYVGVDQGGCPNATQAATWGKVKALYR